MQQMVVIIPYGSSTFVQQHNKALFKKVASILLVNHIGIQFECVAIWIACYNYFLCLPPLVHIWKGN